MQHEPQLWNERGRAHRALYIIRLTVSLKDETTHLV